MNAFFQNETMSEDLAINIMSNSEHFHPEVVMSYPSPLPAFAHVSNQPQAHAFNQPQAHAFLS